MSVTIYTCDTCKRDIELVENDNSITLVDNCIITQNCKGNLVKSGSRPNGVIGKQTPTVEGLEDYDKRGRMFVHEQTLPSSAWNIVHNLNTNPIVHVYIDAVTTESSSHRQLPQDEFVVVILSENEIDIQFADNTIGIAHVLARPNVEQPTDPVPEAPTVQASANGILTIATPVLVNDEQAQTYSMAFTSPSTSQVIEVDVEFFAHKFDESLALFNTPWREAQSITWNDALYRVRSVRLATILNAFPIEDGSPFYFVDNPDAIILTSNSPYENDADIRNLVVPISKMPQDAFSQNRVTDSEIHVETDLMVDYFPALQVVKTILQ